MGGDFPRPYALQFRGNRLVRLVLRMAGWKLLFEGFPTRQGVMIAYPHTSNWDTVVLLFGKVAAGVPMVFLSKASLFRIPLFGRYLRWMGGLPVDRAAAGGMAGQMVAAMAAARAEDRYFWLTLTPEGTRARTGGLRSGFYRIALEAGVPVGVIRLDYGRREIHILDFIQVTGDREADMARIAQVLEGAVARHPRQASPLKLLK